MSKSHTEETTKRSTMTEKDIELIWPYFEQYKDKLKFGTIDGIHLIIEWHKFLYLLDEALANISKSHAEIIKGEKENVITNRKNSVSVAKRTRRIL